MNHSKSSTHVGKDQTDKPHTIADADGGQMSTGGGIHAPDQTGEPLRVQLGRQLRDAREAHRLDLHECGQALRLPVRILRQLESGDYSGIDHGVYLRNYLETYGTHVGLSKQDLHATIQQLAPRKEQPHLVSTGGISRSHYMWQRYTTAATYVVLTAVIVVPLVWLGIQGGLDRELTHLEPLNSAPVAKQELASSTSGADRHNDADAGQGTTSDTRHADARPSDARPSDDERPLMASMAPFSALDSVPAVKPKMPDIRVPGSHVLRLSLTEPSWVEITTADGERLEYSLLPAGAERSYHSSKQLQVNIGDATGIHVQLDGKAVDLEPYQRANVARFRVETADGKALVQSM